MKKEEKVSIIAMFLGFFSGILIGLMIAWILPISYQLAVGILDIGCCFLSGWTLVEAIYEEKRK